MTRGMEQLSYGDRLRELELLSLERRMLWGDLIAAFQSLKAYKKDMFFLRSIPNQTILQFYDLINIFVLCMVKMLVESMLQNR